MCVNLTTKSPRSPPPIGSPFSEAHEATWGNRRGEARTEIGTKCDDEPDRVPGFSWPDRCGTSRVADTRADAKSMRSIVVIATLCGLVLLVFSPAWYANFAVRTEQF